MNTQKYELMKEGGRRLGIIRDELAKKVAAGLTPLELDTMADQLIVKGGDYPSFKTVAGYHHATCINVGSAVVHGIPSSIPFNPGDLVTIDVGLVHGGWHLDTSVTVQVAPHDPKITRFLEAGRRSVNSAIAQALPGKTIYDVSRAMEDVIKSAGYSVILDLTGHGLGKTLHEAPHIPCYADERSKKEVIRPGMALAIEVMYAMGNPNLKLAPDGWTLVTVDGSLTGMFEESVFITEKGQDVLTKGG